MTSPGVAIVGAAETAEIGTVAASSLGARDRRGTPRARGLRVDTGRRRRGRRRADSTRISRRSSPIPSASRRAGSTPRWSVAARTSYTSATP